MKKVAVILALLMLTCIGAVYAAEVQDVQKPAAAGEGQEAVKPKVAVVFVNNAKTTYDQELGDRLMGAVTAKLSRYEVAASGAAAVERLTKAGVADMNMVEKADMVAAFKDADFVVWLELQPVALQKWGAVFSEGVTAVVSVPLKVVDVKNNRYSYHNKFSEQADNRAVLTNLVVPVSMVGTKAAALAALDKVSAKLAEALSASLPQQ